MISDNLSKYLSITDFTKIIKNNLEHSYPLLFLKGEISNFKPSSTGHWYFVLKDQNSAIKAIIFKGAQSSILELVKHNLSMFKDGVEVLVEGRLSVYERNGEYSIIINKMIPVGIGELSIKYEALKDKLFKEGLFDQNRKKELPIYPINIGIVTSPTGAALQDMINVLKRRSSSINVTVYPTSVQGEDAKYEIVKAIECAEYHYKNNTSRKPDVLIIARGGGSIEDLWAFNEEIVAYSIANCPIPTITGIGHEVDFTIADYCSDYRAPTPSVAAEIVSKNRADLINSVSSYLLRLEGAIEYVIERYNNRLSHCSSDKVMSYFMRLYENKLVDYSFIRDRINHKFEDIRNQKRNQLEYLVGKLDNLSPLKILSRGYSIVLSENNKLIKASDDVSLEENINIILDRGRIKAHIISKE